MRHIRHKSPNKRSDHVFEQVPLQAIAIVNDRSETELLQLDKTTNRGKKMVFDGAFTADLKTFNVAYLLNGAVILLNLPMPVMLFGEGFMIKSSGLLLAG